MATYDLAWLDSASSLLATLETLSVLQRTEEQLTHMLRYIPASTCCRDWTPFRALSVSRP